MQAVTIVQITPEELEELIYKAVIKCLKDFNPKSAETPKEDYMSRSAVAEMLDVDLSTIHNWTKKGKLKSCGIGARVYYKRSEIESALNEYSPVPSESAKTTLRQEAANLFDSLPVRLYNILRSCDILTTEQAAELTFKEFIKFRNAGKKSWYLLQDFLYSRGYTPKQPHLVNL